MILKKKQKKQSRKNNDTERCISRDQTVAAIIIVSRDGCRVSSALVKLMQVYQRAFGEAWARCICVFIGQNGHKLSEEERNQKRHFFADRVSQETGREFPDSRVYFYDARDSDPQTDLDRFNTMLRRAIVMTVGGEADRP